MKHEGATFHASNDVDLSHLPVYDGRPTKLLLTRSDESGFPARLECGSTLRFDLIQYASETWLRCEHASRLLRNHQLRLRTGACPIKSSS